MCCRIARHLGIEPVIGVDLVPGRLERARQHGADVLDLSDFDDDQQQIVEALSDRTHGRGPDSVIDAVGMEAHGSRGAKVVRTLTGLLPDKLAEKMMQRSGIDRLAALQLAIDVVRRGGTISIAGVYGGMSDPLPMLVLFDKQIQLRMGQCNARRWLDDLMPLVEDRDVLGVEGFASHHLPLADAAHAYEIFQKKQDDAFKVIVTPGAG